MASLSGPASSNSSFSNASKTNHRTANLFASVFMIFHKLMQLFISAVQAGLSPLPPYCSVREKYGNPESKIPKKAHLE
jgi:hypothetical protein